MIVSRFVFVIDTIRDYVRFAVHSGISLRAVCSGSVKFSSDILSRFVSVIDSIRDYVRFGIRTECGLFNLVRFG